MTKNRNELPSVGEELKAWSKLQADEDRDWATLRRLAHARDTGDYVLAEHDADTVRVPRG